MPKRVPLGNPVDLAAKPSNESDDRLLRDCLLVRIDKDRKRFLLVLQLLSQDLPVFVYRVEVGGRRLTTGNRG